MAFLADCFHGETCIGSLLSQMPRDDRSYLRVVSGDPATEHKLMVMTFLMQNVFHISGYAQLHFRRIIEIFLNQKLRLESISVSINYYVAFLRSITGSANVDTYYGT
jgi:hypothetical protein